MLESNEIGIERIGYTLAGKSIDSYIKHKSAVTKEFLASVVGIDTTYHLTESESALTLCLDAFHKVGTIDLARIGAICVVSQHTEANIPPLSNRLHGELGILAQQLLCFDLSLGCTGYVQGLSILKSVMREYGIESALLFNVETLSKVLDESDLNTNLIFSDAATCTLVSHSAVFNCSTMTFGTDSSKWTRLSCTNNKLFMDGPEIYNFVARKVPNSIRELLKLNNLSVSDIDRFVLHQASKRTVEKLRQSLALSEIQCPFDILKYGNTGSCTIPIILEKYLDNQSIHSLLLSSFGSGLAWANMILRRKF